MLKTLLGYSEAWKNHPAVKMWRGHEGSLGRYGLIVCQEWINRGYKDSCLEKIDRLIDEVPADNESRFINPEWLTDKFCASHRSNLLRKDPEWYGKFGWVEKPNLPYVWPREK